MAGLADAFQPSWEQVLRQREQALQDLASERQREDEEWLGRQTKGFGAGLLSPLWWIAQPKSEAAQQFKDTMDQWQEEGPGGASIGASLPAGYGTAAGVIGYMGARNRRDYPSYRPAPGAFRRDLMNLGPSLAGMIAPFYMVTDQLLNAPRRQEQRRAREYGAAGY